MLTNVGSLDRVLRIVLGLALIIAAFLPALGLAASAVLQWGVVAVGGILIATALMRFCPIYRLFGLSTCKVSR